MNEDVLDEARGVTPGDRWDTLKKTSPSGKTLFRCRSCGREDVSPSKYCFQSEPDITTSLGAVFKGGLQLRLDCVTWMKARLRRYQLQSERGEGWAIIVIGEDGYFSAVSDYGNYSFIWGAHGEKDFRRFLLNVEEDWDYFARKLSMGRDGKEYDGEATLSVVKEIILDRRRRTDWSARRARVEWDLLEDFGQLEDSEDFTAWLGETGIEDAWEYRRERFNRQLEAFCTKTLKRLAEILRKELEQEGLIARRSG